MNDAPQRVVLATRNAHKIGELRAILADLGVVVDLVGVAEFPGVADVAETELSFAGNALLKAVAVAEATGLPAIADDSGICVDALNGMPGIFSARWAGRHGDDAANLDLLLAQVSDVPDEHRGAAFVCAAALAEPGPDGRRIVEEGRINGVLLRERHGEGGFGYDPVFRPHGHDVSTAELTAEAKNRISHRRRAFAALAPHLVRG
ncbi:RdgB/HAM1 family non-canonical purine NTP pyrophosphatase [Actinospica sp. MGRD01-02]|uniref:dITP/XTP pyrophosphatase n=1 Tax=Actinospica acidithermotolerans TaxID=2828514 RepID=A0A941EAA9_9ACTN|nr:RdgB/HAM1 family non-canonical purine NTP pyrophosphatase [Actinospica acidithermotolerans]MBR7825414.1 RdgB/HAM1 family non-canonical purine NTP pyrophosphatase [Actinospica acidithermotolerans]